mgnify:CR=1 FL=1
MDKYADLSRRQQQVLSALEGRDDGVPSSEIARSLGLTTGYVSEVLRSLRDRGLASCSSIGRFARWGRPAAIVALRETNASAAAQAAQARAAARKAREEDEAEAFSAGKFAHHRINAADAPPIKCLGPASVFNVAAMHQPTNPPTCRRAESQ